MVESMDEIKVEKTVVEKVEKMVVEKVETSAAMKAGLFQKKRRIVVVDVGVGVGGVREIMLDVEMIKIKVEGLLKGLYNRSRVGYLFEFCIDESKAIQ